MIDLNDFFLNASWYHVINFKEHKSKGVYDVGNYIEMYQFEDNYTGKTVIDVGAADGYFSFLMKERGAEKVVAIDSNKFDGTIGMQVAKFNEDSYRKKYDKYIKDYERFKSLYNYYGQTTPNKITLLAKMKQLEIEFFNGSIYDLKEYGRFDVSLCLDLLNHLKDPITALEQLSLVTNEKCIISLSNALEETFMLRMLQKFFIHEPIVLYQGYISGGSFYRISENALINMCKAADFKKVEIINRFNMKNLSYNTDVYHLIVHAYK